MRKYIKRPLSSIGLFKANLQVKRIYICLVHNSFCTTCESYYNSNLTDF